MRGREGEKERVIEFGGGGRVIEEERVFFFFFLTVSFGDGGMHTLTLFFKTKELCSKLGLPLFYFFISFLAVAFYFIFVLFLCSRLDSLLRL